MGTLIKTSTVRWLVIALAALSVPACSLFQFAPVTQIPPITQVIPVYQITVVTQVQEVTRIIPVTEIVVVTRVIEVQPAIPAPAPTQAPAMTEAPLAAPVPAPTQAPPPMPFRPLPNEAVLVWYDFEDDFLSSGLVRDRSGNGFDALVNGAVGVDRGVSGNRAISFFGNGFIQAQGNPAAGRNSVSFSLWFKTDHPENNYKLASAAWWGGGPGSGWIMATHMPEFWSDDTRGLYKSDITINENYFTAGEWIHEVVTYDGSHIREYTNGQIVNDWPTTGAAIGQGQPMAVGAWPLFQGYNFQGSIDEFKIYGWALTWEEVQDLYNQER